MQTTPRALATLARDRKGATAVEYGLILALIVIALMVGVIALGGSSHEVWGNIYDRVHTVSPA